MSEDPNRQLARSVVVVQNLQLKLIGGMIVGFIVGVLLAAYVILPMEGDAMTWITLLAVFTPIIGIFVGQRTVLSILSR